MVANRKSTAREGTWSPVRESLTDHLNTKTTAKDSKSVWFSENVKKFKYYNKDSEDELLLYATDVLEINTQKMTVRNMGNKLTNTYLPDRRHTL